MGSNSIPVEMKVEICQRILERAMEITDSTKHDIFVWYAPHVNTIEVHIHRGGWKTNKRCTTLDVDFGSEFDDVEGAVANIDAVLDTLENA